MDVSRRHLLTLGWSHLREIFDAPEAEGTAEGGEAAGVHDTRVASRLPNIQLTTHEGESLRFCDDLVRERTVVAHLFSREHPDACGPVAENLAAMCDFLQQRIGRDIWLVSLCVEPGLEGLRRAAEAHGARAGWLFASGDPDEVRTLGWALGFRESKEDETELFGLVAFGNDRINRWAALPALTDAPEIARAVLRIAGVAPVRSD